MNRQLSTLITLLISTALFFQNCGKKAPATGEGNPDLSPTFEITYPKSPAGKALDGRLLLLISNNDKAEPRFQINDSHGTQMVFGVDVEAWQASQPKVVDGSAFGYPIRSLADVPAGEYYVQALLHLYETFNRKDGHNVKLPMDRGEGLQWNRAPGNLYSAPQKMRLGSKAGGKISISLDSIISPIEPPKDSKYVKHIRIQSKLLSEWWGRPMFLGAHVLIPEGWDSHPEARYPLAINHGHFPADFGDWRTTPPDPNLKPDTSERFRIRGYNRIVQQENYDFYKIWTGPNFPRVVAIEIQHPCPYYDDSYAVNSANCGPYGDAITYELIPHIEKEFRCIGQGWSRFLYGGSTGGWEALAAQVFYPTEYGGCYAACPDPVDFRAYCLVNIYEDKNAYYYDSPFKKLLRPAHRDYLGQIQTTMQDNNYRELALGSNSRSGDQWDIWQAVYSPCGADGYPVPIFDKLTGEIDHTVAAHWKENYDLAWILKRDWKKNAVHWKGKIHLYCGDMDNYYLNNSVYLAEDILKKLDPPYDGEVDYGDRAEHCWNGDHTQPNYISRLRYNRMFIPKWTEEVQKWAPKGADLTSWRY